MNKIKFNSQNHKKDVKENIQNPKFRDIDIRTTKIEPPKTKLDHKPINRIEQHTLEPHYTPKNKIRAPKLPRNYKTRNKIEPPQLKPDYKPINKIKPLTLLPNNSTKNKIQQYNSQLLHSPKNKITPRKSGDKNESVKSNITHPYLDKPKQDALRDKQGNVIKYSTLWLIENLRKEVGKLVPDEKYHGELAYWKLSKYIYDKNSKKGYDYIQKSIMSRFKSNSKIYNPNYKFSKETLSRFIENLHSNFSIENVNNAINYIKLYIKNNQGLKDKACQQWHLHKPNLIINYFNKIDTIEKGYWLGFLMADGSVLNRKHYYLNGIKCNRKTPKKEIFLELSKNDEIIINRFCNCIGIDKNHIKNRTRKHYRTGKSHKYVYIRFTNNKMAKDLELQGFASSKAKRKTLPNFYKQKMLKESNSPSNRELLMAFVRGYYDGDGFSGTTRICSSSKQFLVRLRQALNIEYRVLRSTRSNLYKDENGKIHFQRAQYSLSIGAQLFKELTDLCKRSNVKVLERKNKQLLGKKIINRMEN
ncbi:MAG: LAGLIDADG family homing endonuclease [Promethearchaeia archaeon]